MVKTLLKDNYKIYLFSIIYAIILFGISSIFPTMNNDYGNIILDKLINFDSFHYFNIANNGYTEDALYAFFPLFPLLMKVFSMIGIPIELSGIVISLLSYTGCYLCLAYLNKDSENKKQILKYFAFSPILCLAFVPYTEYLYMFLSLLSFIFIKEKKPLLAGIFIGLCCGIKNMGFVMFCVFFLQLYSELKEMPLKAKIRPLITYSIPAILLGSIYPFYLLFKTGDLIKFATVQSTVWDRFTCFPWTPIINDLIALKNLPSKSIVIILSLIMIAFTIYIICKSFKKEKILSLMLTFGMIFPLCSCCLRESVACTGSIIRYVLFLFPIYILMGNLNISNNKRILLNLIYYTLTFLCCMLFFMEGFIY